MSRAADPSRAGPWLWLGPALLVLGAIYLWPLLDAVRLAFTDATLLRAPTRVSLDAFAAVLSDPALPGILRVTGIFTAASVILLQALGLGIALLVHRGDRRGLPGMAALRALVLAAWVVPGIANGVIWQIVFSEAPFGGLNAVLAVVGLGPVAWLSDPALAMLSAIIANIWQGTAFSMILYYAALKGLDPALQEAAKVDGASALDRFALVTLPQLKGTILAGSVLVTIQTLGTFDSILALTGGGPGQATEVLSLYTYNTVFRGFDLSRGAVLALLLAALSLAAAALYALILRERR
ncbi:ABC transporter permease [Thioclava dalianensis]|uniref:ABC transporter permease n=1 Tax=Thioclava dalianensis TaxID=1185766 RepID=A0A074T8H6_9RHOB|nr:sugar ABC transporter permease [Thioclava dalianensis]KEP68106.1 ABC transporter permease [Thioclava dalianensis]SFN39099.1 multiple sugar transport system permease protein [Thioclava dalianensis]